MAATTQEEKNNSTFPQISHLQRIHPAHYTIFTKKNEQTKTVEPTIAKESTPEIEIPQMFTSAAIQKKESAKIHRAITSMIAIDLMSLTTVEKPGFKNLIATLRPNFKLKSRWSITREDLPNLYDEYKAKLEDELLSVDHAVLGFDLWSDEGSKHEVNGVIVYFLQNNEVVHRVLGVLNCRESKHTAQNIALGLKELISEYKIEGKIVCMCRDGGSNVQNACDLLKCESFDCLSHKLHLAANDATKNMVGVGRVLLLYKKLVRKLKKSTVTAKQFESIQEVLELPVLCLQKSSSVRWSHMKLMFDRALIRKSAIEKLMETNNTLPQLTENDWNVIQNVSDVFTPIDLFSKKTQDRETPASQVIPLCYALIDHCKESIDHPEAFKAIEDRMQKELKKYSACRYLQFATLLDPRYKDHFCTDEFKHMFIEEFEKCNEDDVYITSDNEVRLLDSHSDSSDEAPAKNAKFDFEKFIEKRISEQPKPIPNCDNSLTARMEVQRYLSTSVEQVNPRQFWTSRVTTSVYPRLCKFAARFIICPSGSAEVERVFSTAGVILNKFRKSLYSEHFKLHLFLSKNIPIMDNTEPNLLTFDE